MPAALIWIVGGFVTLAVGGGLKLAGDAVDEAGNGALKLAGAAAIAVGVFIAVRKL